MTGPLSAASIQQLTITRSESFNQDGTKGPGKAHDGNLNSVYSPKDGEVEGNFLKLYLSQAYSITEVKMISRADEEYAERMIGTEATIYRTTDKVASCGKITGGDV